jgi:chorismate--pyruvate lyase
VLRAAPRGILPWLTDHHSLTAAVRARCGELRVQVLRQGLGRVLRDEAPMVGVRPGARVWVREVALVADGVPWVWARSVARPGDLRTAWRDLAGLGNRSLGAALFADPRVGRGNLLARALDWRDPRGRAAGRDLLGARVMAAGASGRGSAPLSAFWGRRSLFCRGQGRIMVTEVFAPAVPARSA